VESATSFIDNPIVLGMLATAITWCAQRVNRAVGKMSVTWLTAVVALGLALGNELWAMRTGYYEIEVMFLKFAEFASTVWPVGRVLITRAMPIFVSTQVIYHSLQSKLAGKVIYGSARVLRRSLDGYEYLAEIVTGGKNGQ